MCRLRVLICHERGLQPYLDVFSKLIM